jgi:5-methylcytosine-specific restriction endonuclease McrA
MSGKRWRSKGTKKLLIEIQRNRCGICGSHMAPLNFNWMDPFFPTLEHVWPRSKARKNAGNLILTHRRCNERKGSAAPTGCELVFLAWVNAKLAENCNVS